MWPSMLEGAALSHQFGERQSRGSSRFTRCDSRPHRSITSLAHPNSPSAGFEIRIRRLCRWPSRR